MPWIRVRAALGDDAHHAAGRRAELGVVTGLLDLDLFDEVDDEALAGETRAQVRRVLAVDDEAVLGLRRAVDHDAGGARAGDVASRS